MRCKTLILLCWVAFLCCGCDRVSVSREVKHFIGKQISFSDKINYYKGFNPYYNKHEDSCGSLVFWFDKNECATCRLSSLDKLRGLFDYCRDSVPCIEVKIIFTPSPEKRETFLDFVENNEFEYPFYIDDQDLFRKDNMDIPLDPLYHVFLLDSNEKVVLVGSPLLNKDMLMLYKETMFSIFKE